MFKIHKCIEALNKHKIILLPTETVYGVAVRYNDEIAKQALMDLKHRPISKQFPVCVGNYQMIDDLCKLDDKQTSIVKALLPGPITLVLPSKDGSTIAIRYSENKFITRLINKLNRPLYLTSANYSGEEVIKSIKEAKKLFNGKIEVYVNGKVCFNKASTIVDVTNDDLKVIRQGDITLLDIKNKLKWR